VSVHREKRASRAGKNAPPVFPLPKGAGAEAERVSIALRYLP
jgi:hypothetical protein